MPSTQRREEELLKSSDLKIFTFNEFKTVTDDNLVGSNGFRIIFKGWKDKHALTLASPITGMQVVVKRVRLHPDNFLGPKEWLGKIIYLGKLHHPNLVKMIGYCVEDEHRLLVHEFMPNGSLDRRIFGGNKYFKPLSWKLRMRVVLGVAKGLAFLHNEGDKFTWGHFKTSNVLLDLDYNAKLYKFGLPRHRLTNYIDPVYMQPRDPNHMCDVYSFGVVLLEVLSGCPVWELGISREQLDLMDWAAHYLNNKSEMLRIFDHRLKGEYSLIVAQKLISLVFQCLYLKREYRPSMAEIVKTLEALQEE